MGHFNLKPKYQLRFEIGFWVLNFSLEVAAREVYLRWPFPSVADRMYSTSTR